MALRVSRTCSRTRTTIQTYPPNNLPSHPHPLHTHTSQSVHPSTSYSFLTSCIMQEPLPYHRQHTALTITYLAVMLQVGPFSDEQPKAALMAILTCNHGDCLAILHRPTPEQPKIHPHRSKRAHIRNRQAGGRQRSNDSVHTLLLLLRHSVCACACVSCVCCPLGLSVYVYRERDTAGKCDTTTDSTAPHHIIE